MDGIALDAGVEPILAWARYWDAFWTLPAAARAVAVVGATVALAAVLVGLFPEYGARGAAKARRHSVTTTLVGAVVVGLFAGSVGALWYGAARSDVVSMLAMPVLFVLVGVAVVWIGIGLVALGEFVAARGGRDDATWGTLAMAVIVAAGALYPPLGAAVLALAALLGFGAGIRTNPFASPNTDRVVPPDRKTP
ncbi:hypothetical protein G9C85_05035 [Halorubellus sp. JP-L1]|uniref:hypothetical protein n=1 Tax=Halorubellus sp. JP-L1 TaxID=2715753 RepID=UPI001407432F|nr:hypothetical protein [Halorubellus sp. JP-L1]NHN41001.1 hypothetical protein [Halorubellus sp. JP-L1]